MSDSELRLHVFLGERTFLFQKQGKMKAGRLELSLLEGYKMAQLVYYTTVPMLREGRTFDFLYLTRKEKKKNVVHSSYKSRYKLDSG